MIDLDEEVLGPVVVEEVPRDARALGHPIEPEPSDRPVDVIAAISTSMAPWNLMPAISAPVKSSPDVDVVDGVAGDRAERRSETADDAGLLAMRDRVVADDVPAAGVLVPAVLEGALDAS